MELLKQLSEQAAFDEELCALVEAHAVDPKNLDKLAQAVWAATDVDKKKAALNKMIDSFKFKDKQEAFRRKIEHENNPKRLDKIAANITLGLKDKVVK